jgi:CRP-like cAMP-binding protein
VDAVAIEPVRAVSWEVVTLQRYLEAHPETRVAMLRHLSRDLAGKLERMSHS